MSIIQHHIFHAHSIREGPGIETDITTAFILVLVSIALALIVDVVITSRAGIFVRSENIKVHGSAKSSRTTKHME